MQVLWNGLLPLLAKDQGFIGIDDVESLSGVKMQRATDVDQHTTIGRFDSSSPFMLSMRIELDRDGGAFSKTGYFWERMQGLTTSSPSVHSTLNLSCISFGRSLSLAKVEADLKSLGYTSQAILNNQKHVEFFAKSQQELAFIFYDLPVETVPEVASVRLTGVKVLRQAAGEKQK